MLPTVWRQPITDVVPYYPSYPTVVEVKPETELARVAPVLAARVLSQQSRDQALVGLANSSSVAEFARQGRGTYVAHRRRGMFFTKSMDEFTIQPI